MPAATSLPVVLQYQKALDDFRRDPSGGTALLKRMSELISLLDPRFMEVEGDFYIRGGIKTKVKVTHSKSGSAFPKA